MFTGKKGISRGNLNDVEDGFLKKYTFTVEEFAAAKQKLLQ